MFLETCKQDLNLRNHSGNSHTCQGSSLSPFQLPESYIKNFPKEAATISSNSTCLQCLHKLAEPTKFSLIRHATGPTRQRWTSPSQSKHKIIKKCNDQEAYILHFAGNIISISANYFCHYTVETLRARA